MNYLAESAGKLIMAGFSPIPIRPVTKRTIGEWKRFQTERAAPEELPGLFDCGDERWIGVTCGEASGMLEAIDFDIPDWLKGQVVDSPAYLPWRDLIEAHGGEELLRKCTIHRTPSGGMHVLYRCHEKCGRNQKLAQRPWPADIPRRPADVQTGFRGDPDRGSLIETRGMGGLIVVAPSPGYVLVQGTYESVPTITADERDLLIDAARLFDEMPQSEVPEATPPRPRMPGELSPGDDFDDRASWSEILEPHGWRMVPKPWQGMTLWVRPGKKISEGWSARTGMGTAGDRLVSWSNSAPFPTERALKKYFVYAVLNHGGDVTEAIRTLGAKGYGKKASRLPDGPSNLAPPSAPPPMNRLIEMEPSDRLPAIDVHDRNLRDMRSDALGALLASNEPPYIFARHGLFVRVFPNERGLWSIKALDGHGMRGVLADCADWYTTLRKNSGPIKVSPPLDAVYDLLSLGAVPIGIPALEGISSAPVVGPSGTIRRQHGYDPESRWYVTTRGDWPEWDGDGKSAAKWLLEEWLCDFPFIDQASRANALALAILPFVRPLIDEPTPLHLVDAPQQGTGKGMLVKACLYPALGRIPAAATLPENETELKKLLFSMVIEGQAVIFLDNLSRLVTSDSLASLVTAGEITDRFLGVSGTITAKVQCVLAGTANNVRLGADFPRRAVWIRLDASREDPDKRKNFKHPKLLGWTRVNRAKLVSALLAMCEEWFRQGKPASEAVKGTFEVWADVVGGILKACDIHGFIANDEELKRKSGDDNDMWRAFYAAWWERYKDDDVSVKLLRELAEEKELLETIFAKATTERGKSTAFGRAMHSQEGRVLNNVAPRKSTMQSGLSRFKLTPTGGLVDFIPFSCAEEFGSDNAHSNNLHNSRAGDLVHQSTTQVQNSGGLSTKVHQNDQEVLI